MERKIIDIEKFTRYFLVPPTIGTYIELKERCNCFITMDNSNSIIVILKLFVNYFFVQQIPVKISIDVSLGTDNGSSYRTFVLNVQLSLKPKMSLEISTDIFLLQPKCRWKFPPPLFCQLKYCWKFHQHFSLTVEMSLEISTDIFLYKLKCRWKFHQHFSLTVEISMKISPTFVIQSLTVGRNFRRHFSLTAKCR